MGITLSHADALGVLIEHADAAGVEIDSAAVGTGITIRTAGDPGDLLVRLGADGRGEVSLYGIDCMVVGS